MLELLTYAFAELLFRGICYPIGWPLVKLFSLGKYPARGGWLAESVDSQWTCAAGLAVLMVAVMITPQATVRLMTRPCGLRTMRL